MAARAPTKGAVGLFKRAWNEIPEIVGSSFMAVVGLVLIGSALQRYKTKNLDNRRYREEYTVVRHDDPRAQTLRTDYLGDQK